MKMGYSFTTVLTDSFSWGIRVATGGAFSHGLMRFKMDSGDLVYFESILKKDAATGKSGLRGPVSIARLDEWAAENRKHVVYHQDWLPMSDEECRASYDFLVSKVPVVKYAPLQLGKNASFALTKRWLVRRSGTYNVWQCAEAQGRALAPRLWPALGIGDVLFDMLVPSGPRGVGVFEHARDAFGLGGGRSADL